MSTELAEMPPPLPAATMFEAVKRAARELGVELLAQDDVIRVYGPPGRFDPYLVTEMWVGHGSLRAECSVPVIVPSNRLDQVLELCLLLNRQGRVGFTMGRRRAPLVAVTCMIPAGAEEVAAKQCKASLAILWQRAAGSELLFRAVAAGNDAVLFAESADSQLPPDFQYAHPGNTFVASRGTEWEDALASAPSLPPGTPVPPGYTEAEYRTTFAALSRGVGNNAPGILDACPGPMMIHADGVVECFGCSEPGATPHLAGCTVACDQGMYLGPGHRCERCETR